MVWCVRYVHINVRGARIRIQFLCKSYVSLIKREARGRAVYKRYVPYLGMIYVILSRAIAIDLCGLPKITVKVLHLYKLPAI